MLQSASVHHWVACQSIEHDSVPTGVRHQFGLALYVVVYTHLYHKCSE